MALVTIDKENRKTGEVVRKIYEPVSDRVRKFRDTCPVKEGWGLTTEVSYPDDQTVKSVAIITDPEGRVVATGTAEETRGASYINRTSAVENCETSAIGRALFAAGFGGGEFASADELLAALRAHKEIIEAEADGVAKIHGGSTANAAGSDKNSTRPGGAADPEINSEDQGSSNLGLPKVAGVQYRREGNLIIAEGKTFQSKGLLKGAGFRWNLRKKTWVKELQQ
jgi:hypothetical protein